MVVKGLGGDCVVVGVDGVVASAAWASAISGACST
jgi:hypothetical protein